MDTDKKLSPCGLYCGVCAIYSAHQSNDLKYKKIALAIYKKGTRNASIPDLQISDIKCDGCRSNNIFVYCGKCQIRYCADSKGYVGCHQCEKFPCRHIDNFPVPEVRKTIIQAINDWRQLGTKNWLSAENKKYTCTICNSRMFRGATRCITCRKKS